MDASLDERGSTLPVLVGIYGSDSALAAARWAAREADLRGAPVRLVVVGSRGRGGLSGMLLGSVGQAMLHHADCPVPVVR
jgi:nucleotide-binding universal stress UspA family protein